MTPSMNTAQSQYLQWRHDIEETVLGVGQTTLGSFSPTPGEVVAHG